MFFSLHTDASFQFFLYSCFWIGRARQNTYLAMQIKLLNVVLASFAGPSIAAVTREINAGAANRTIQRLAHFIALSPRVKRNQIPASIAPFVNPTSMMIIILIIIIVSSTDLCF